MTATMKVRSGGAWVSRPAETGYVRVAGAWVPYGSAAVTYETITWPLDPADTDESDGGQAYNMGLEFSVASSVVCSGVNWRVPDVVANPNGDVHAASIWEVGGSRVAYQEFTPVTGGYQDITFTAKPTLAVGDYIAVVFTNHYVYRATSPAGLTSSSGNLTATQGRLVSHAGTAAAAPYPTGTTSLNFYVRPICAVP